MNILEQIRRCNAQRGESNRAKGLAFEFKVLRLLKKRGAIAIRSAGSHSLVDLVQIKTDRIMLVNCKENGVWCSWETRKLEELSQNVPSGTIVVKAFKNNKNKVIFKQIEG